MYTVYVLWFSAGRLHPYPSYDFPSANEPTMKDNMGIYIKWKTAKHDINKTKPWEYFNQIMWVK